MWETDLQGLSLKVPGCKDELSFMVNAVLQGGTASPSLHPIELTQTRCLHSLIQERPIFLCGLLFWDADVWDGQSVSTLGVGVSVGFVLFRPIATQLSKHHYYILSIITLVSHCWRTSIKKSEWWFWPGYPGDQLVPHQWAFHHKLTTQTKYLWQ